MFLVSKFIFGGQKWLSKKFERSRGTTKYIRAHVNHVVCRKVEATSARRKKIEEGKKKKRSPRKLVGNLGRDVCLCP